MSLEVLSHPEDQEVLTSLENSLVTAVGATVFEKLAVDSKEAFDQPEGVVDGKIMMSVTRLGDGQTVPDER